MATSSNETREYILAGDVGGTNTNLALVEASGANFTIVEQVNLVSREVTDFAAAVEETLAGFGSGYSVNRCCISAAGHAAENRCRLTNLDWVVDGDLIEQRLGVPTVVINDFLALSYSLPLLDTADPAQVTPLPHFDGSTPEPQGDSWAIIGAGTGLGVGHLIRKGGRYIAVPSEGGHSDFPAFDKETQRLGNYLKVRYDSWPGTECVLSGRGIANIYAFIRDGLPGPPDEVLSAVDALPEHERPALIARHGTSNPHCARVMELFTRIYGKVAGNTALNFLPTAGLFLAGGIAQKNINYLVKEQRFMRYFESNYNPKLRAVQHRTPVYLIREYSVSLLGAAHAAVVLTAGEA